MGGFPELGDRIRERLQALGYWKHGRPDVTRFALPHGLHPMYVYKWLGGVTPARENLEKLGKALDVTPAWLLFGDRDETQTKKDRPRKARLRKAGVAFLVAATMAGTAGGYAAGDPRADKNILPLIRTGRNRAA